jgi:hypothetical protein
VAVPQPMSNYCCGPEAWRREIRRSMPVPEFEQICPCCGTSLDHVVDNRLPDSHQLFAHICWVCFPMDFTIRSRRGQRVATVTGQTHRVLGYHAIRRESRRVEDSYRPLDEVYRRDCWGCLISIACVERVHQDSMRSDSSRKAESERPFINPHSPGNLDALTARLSTPPPLTSNSSHLHVKAPPPQASRQHLGVAEFWIYQQFVD